MAMPEKYRQFGNELVELLKLRTMPVAVKMLEKRETPENALLPKRDLGKHLTLCQAFSLVRREGRSVAMFKEDYWCVWPVIALGLVECTKKCVDEVHDKMFIKDPALSRQVFENSFPRLEYGRYAGMLLSPLPKTEFIPDVILVYANPAQMILLINGLQWAGYKKLEWGAVGESACADSWGRALATGEPSLALPCFPERRYGGVPDDELLMALKPAQLAQAVEGVKSVVNDLKPSAG